MLFSSVQNLGWMVKLQEQNTNEVISEEIEKKIECKRRTSSVVEKKVSKQRAASWITVDILLYYIILGHPALLGHLPSFLVTSWE